MFLPKSVFSVPNSRMDTNSDTRASRVVSVILRHTHVERSNRQHICSTVPLSLFPPIIVRSPATTPAFFSAGLKASVPLHQRLTGLLAELFFVSACLMQKPKSTVSIVLAH